MCGRYQFSMEESGEIQEIVRDIGTGMQAPFANGEVFPTDAAPVLLWRERPRAAAARWGFSAPDLKRGVINARAETAMGKPMFRECLRKGRCVVPSTGFYEWDADKTKYLFRLEGEQALYMAGLYREDAEGKRYCILTTAANESIKDVHSRMPLVIRKSQIASWLQDEEAARRMLAAAPPMLIRSSVSGQMRLW